jgi:endonuclease/exonuclease/phosphatase family metal-dependent hydrolase
MTRPRLEGGALRVASYNIHKGVLGVGPAKRLRIHELQEGLREIEADLVFLQEVQFEHRRHARRFAHWPELPQHEWLGRGLGMHTAYRTNATTRHGEHGNALLSRFPVLDVAHHDISDHRFEQRGLLHVRLALREALTLHCIVVHFGLFGGGRRRQLARLVEFIRTHVDATEPVIVAGDFNDWRGALGAELASIGVADVCTLQPARSGGTRWLHRVRTFPALLPVMPLDRIYARGYAAQRIALGWGPAWARLSDHAPLLVELAPLDPRAAS